MCEGVGDAVPALGRAPRPARVLTRVRESAVAAWPGQNRAGDARWDQEGWEGGRLETHPAPENAGALVAPGSEVVFHLKAKDNTQGHNVVRRSRSAGQVTTNCVETKTQNRAVCASARLHLPGEGPSAVPNLPPRSPSSSSSSGGLLADFPKKCPLTP